MSTSDDVREVKLFLHHGYDNVESGPAEEVGQLEGRLRLRLLFIPFMYASPTYDDVVLAARDDEFHDSWAFEVTGPYGMDDDDLEAPGAHYTVVVEYRPGGEQEGLWFPGREDIPSSVATEPSGDEPGRLYLAPPKGLSASEVMALLRAGHPRYLFTLIHPKP